MELAYLLGAEMVNHKGEHDWSPLVDPQDRGDGALLVLVLAKALFQKLVGEAARLGKAINTIIYFEIHPSIMDELVDIVLVDEILRDVGELDLDVLGIVKRHLQVVVDDVVVDKLCSFSGEHAVEKEFAEIKRGGFGSNVAVVDYADAHDGDAHAVQILFFGVELAHHLRDGD